MCYIKWLKIKLLNVFKNAVFTIQMTLEIGKKRSILNNTIKVKIYHIVLSSLKLNKSK